MTNIFFILTLISAVAVAVTLGLGLFVMAKGGEADRHLSNRLMRARVFLQGLTIALFLLALVTARK